MTTMYEDYRRLIRYLLHIMLIRKVSVLYPLSLFLQGKYVNGARSRDYNVYSTFQSHEPEFDYLKSLEIEEKINQIKWLKKKNAANFILSTNGKELLAGCFLLGILSLSGNDQVSCNHDHINFILFSSVVFFAGERLFFF